MEEGTCDEVIQWCVVELKTFACSGDGKVLGDIVNVISMGMAVIRPGAIWRQNKVKNTQK